MMIVKSSYNYDDEKRGINGVERIIRGI